MSSRIYRFLQILLLVALGAFLVEKALSGKLTWYINVRFMPLTLLGIALLTIMVIALIRHTQKTANTHEHLHANPVNLLVLLIPVLVGVLVPDRPLDAAAVASKGVTLNAPLVASENAEQQFDMAADERNIVDWLRIFSSESDLSPYLEQQASVIGFVYRDESLPENQFLVSRFVITCCAADAFALGIPVEWDGEMLEDNVWVKVKGGVEVSYWQNQKVPLILAESLEVVAEPEQPYLIP